MLVFVGKPSNPCLAPRPSLLALQAIFSQESANTELGVGSATNQLGAMSHQSPQLANRLGGKPDFGQVVDPGQIGQQPGIAQVGLVGRPFHPSDIAGMSQLDRQVSTRRQFFGQIGRTTARLDRHPFGSPMSGGNTRDGSRIVFDRPIRQLLALVVENAYLDRILERVALTCSQYCTVSLQFFAEKRLHIIF